MKPQEREFEIPDAFYYKGWELTMAIAANNERAESDGRPPLVSPELAEEALERAGSDRIPPGSPNLDSFPTETPGPTEYLPMLQSHYDGLLARLQRSRNTSKETILDFLAAGEGLFQQLALLAQQSDDPNTFAMRGYYFDLAHLYNIAQRDPSIALEIISSLATKHPQLERAIRIIEKHIPEILVGSIHYPPPDSLSTVHTIHDVDRQPKQSPPSNEELRHAETAYKCSKGEFEASPSPDRLTQFIKIAAYFFTLKAEEFAHRGEPDAIVYLLQDVAEKYQAASADPYGAEALFVADHQAGMIDESLKDGKISNERYNALRQAQQSWKLAAEWIDGGEDRNITR